MTQDHNNYWKKLGSETIFKHPRLVLEEDDVRLPDGVETKYLRFSGLLDYVTVVAEQDDRIVLLKEYSYPLDEWLWQFPEGLFNESDDAVSAARRELTEETGLIADKMKVIGMNYGHHRRTDQKNHVLLASGLKEGGKLTGDAEEIGTETHRFSLEEIKQMVRNGEIKQKNTLAALALYLIHSGSDI
jgi:8-oxo-dGTP pyrophosphatase MutT (NUDIX family)